MFQCKPLHCELCSCQATSPIQAKMHYEGKTHDKNVRMFFTNWVGNVNKTIPQKLVPSDKKQKPNQVINHLMSVKISCYFVFSLTIRIFTAMFVIYTSPAKFNWTNITMAEITKENSIVIRAYLVKLNPASLIRKR